MTRKLSADEIGEALDELQLAIRRSIERRELPECEHSFSVTEASCARCGAPAKECES